MSSYSSRFERVIVVTLMVLLLGLAFSVQRPAPYEPLRVAVGIWPGAESLTLARERGLLPEDRFRLVEMTWPGATYRAFDNGVVDAAVLSLDGVLRLRASGESMRVIDVLDVSKGADALVAGAGTASVADLKGRRVGVDVRGPGMYVFHSVLISASMKASDVEIVPLLQPEMEPAFVEGTVDAVVSAEPWLTSVRKAGARVVVDSGSVLPPVYRVLVVSERAFVERRKDLVQLVRAHRTIAKQLDFGVSRQEMDAIVRREALTPEEFIAALGRVGRLSFEESCALLAKGPGGIANLAAEIEARAGVREGDGEGRVPSENGDDWVDDSILKSAGP